MIFHQALCFTFRKSTSSLGKLHTNKESLAGIFANNYDQNWGNFKQKIH